MFYRENGQFKTSYRADQQIFPIAQDRWFVVALVLLAFIAVPMLASDYLMRAIVTRPEREALQWVAALQARGATVVLQHARTLLTGAEPSRQRAATRLSAR